MKRIHITLLFLFSTLFLSAQTEGVSINRTGAEPDSSAMLDIQSSTKGLLIPRMDSSSRIAISNPAEGLMVYDSTTQSFWYYQQAWQELGENIPVEIRDADGDTYVQVEATADEDTIRLIAAGKEIVAIDSTETLVQTDFFAGRSVAVSSSRIIDYSFVGSFNTSRSQSSDWQSFTPPSGGKLDFIQLYLNATPRERLDRNYTIRFYEGEGTGGRLLSTTNISPRRTFSGWRQITFPDEIILDKGAIYTIGFSSRNGTAFEGGNLYPSGRSGVSLNRDYMLRVNAFTTPYALNVMDGKVGIGTANLTRAQVEIVGSINNQITTGMFGISQAGIVSLPLGDASPEPYSLYATHRIAASGFYAHSDARIKTIQGLSNSSADLSTLMQIEVTDYRMKDSLTKGNTPYKKVIAQQVAEVYPQAVTNTLTEVVPDIYQRAEVQDGWIMLPTDLQVGERVKVITESSSDIHEVTAVEADRFQVNGLSFPVEDPANGEPVEENKGVFIYGREVNDFHTVDYEAISMLNVSATQAQQNKIEALEAEISSQKSEIDAQQAEINVLTQQLQAFQSLQTEQSRLAQELATLKAALQTQP
ncbi:MAG: tail fiber domain-containing protein [Bacteroidota bacterium]